MSMNYSAVFPSFWTGTTGRLLRGDLQAQVIAHYLMTSPHANIIGVYHCPLSYICEDTGSPIEGASKGLLRLDEVGFCTVDSATSTIWVHEMAFYQIGKELKPTDKRLKYIHRFFDAIPNIQIKRAFFEKYGAAFLIPEPPNLLGKISPIEGASKGLPSPIEGGSATITSTSTITDTSVPTERTLVASPADLEKELFDRGKQVLGKSAGGQIVKLKNAKGGNTALARAAIEQASTKQNPAEYIAAVIKGGTGPPAFGQRHTNGWAELIVDDHQNGQGHEPDSNIIDVTPNKPAGSGGAEPPAQLIGGR
jgi:hypothetical protein